MEMAERAVPELAGGGGKGQDINMLKSDQLLTRAVSERSRHSIEPLVPSTATGLFKLLSSISSEEQVREAGPAGKLPTAQPHLSLERLGLAEALEET